MKAYTLLTLDKIAFVVYVGTVLYALNPILLALVTTLCLSSVIPTIQMQMLAFAGTVIVGALYHKFLWLILRRQFMRYECMYFNIFVPHLVDRRKHNIPVKHCKRKGDTQNVKRENQQRASVADACEQAENTIKIKS